MKNESKIKLFIYEADFKPVLIIANNREEAQSFFNVGFPTRNLLSGFEKELALFRGQCTAKDHTNQWKKVKVI
ncbi:MAG: hypothetical protein NT066_08045 [Candidatus Omnitrophica bacterium]|nr:hypothetical protein [Candidatus Omnitrophota bacterium]